MQVHSAPSGSSDNEFHPLVIVVGCYGSLRVLSILQVCCDPPHSSIRFMALFADSFST